VLHRDAGRVALKQFERLSELTVPLIGSTITPSLYFCRSFLQPESQDFFRALAVTMTVSCLRRCFWLTWTQRSANT